MLFIDPLKTYCLILLGWLKAHVVALGVISVASFVCSILFCTLAIAYLPTDYFLSKRKIRRVRHPVLRIALKVVKNLIAVVLIVVGFVQIPLPGQGVLTILIGIVISDIPGKRKLERWIIRLPAILSAANNIRSRFRRPLLVLDESME